MDEEDWYDFDLSEIKADELGFSRRLDVHRWSDHSEVNIFVDSIYSGYFGDGYRNIRKKHLKVVLLDLYVAWSTDTELKVSYSRNANDYFAGSIYNELNISRLTIDVVDRLEETGFVVTAIGFKNRETGVGRLSRMWPTERLIGLFQRAKFSVYDISYSEDRLPIELRDGEKNPIEFDITSELEASIKLLNNYNHILKCTHVSVPYYSAKRIEADDSDVGSQRIVLVSQADKFVSRVFNDSSFSKGGRFYGGWWIRCPKTMRDDILMNNNVTVEIDYSSLHPTILYASVGINYWVDVAVDPYQIDALSFQNDPAELRNLAKSVMLILFNIDDQSALPAAFRKQAPTGSYKKKLKNDQIFEIVDKVRELHSPIAEFFCSGIGLDLQNEDSKIAERILRHFVDMNEPILIIHDSFIVREPLHEKLALVMEKSYRDVIGKDMSSEAKYVGWTYEDVMGELNLRYSYAQARQSPEEQAEDLTLYRKIAPQRSDEFLRDWELFKLWRTNINKV